MTDATVTQALTFFFDPGHGWLIVTRDLFAAVGLTERDISTYSYQQGDLLGLEEDCDTMTFFKAYEAKYGAQPPILEKAGTCRHWARFGSKTYEEVMASYGG